MKRAGTMLGVLWALVAGTAQAQEQAREFDRWFDGRQMRLDYVHAGGADGTDDGGEAIYFVGVRQEPLWAGSREALIDESGFGSKLVKVFDGATGELIFSRSYCALWDEWRLTAEAKRTPRAMPESVVFPWPRALAWVQIWSRNPANGEFVTCFEYTLDPTDKFISRYGPRYETFDVEPNKLQPANTVDVVLLPEGYTAGERKEFEKAARGFAEAIFSFEPFRSLRGRFRVSAVWVPSQASGVTDPGQNQWRHTSAGASFYTLDSERYQMTENHHALRDQVAHVPCDLIYVLSNSDKYGGGGIYNFYGLSSAGERAPARGEVYVHEFAHLLAGLADEYVGGVSYEEQSTYLPDREPWEVNITTQVNLESKPWHRMLGTNGVGLFEGGGYVSKGVWRPTENCMMNSLHSGARFCPVCEAGIRERVEFLTR